MSDNPRDILKAAGAECAEVEAVIAYERKHGPGWSFIDQDKADAAILALARLVAKYKWQRDATVSVAGYNEEEAQELLDEVDLEWHEEERRRRAEYNEGGTK